MGLIKNQKLLASSALRKDALMILEAGLAAVETGGALKRVVVRRGKELRIGKKKYQLDHYRRIFVIAIGKAAFTAALTLEKILGDRITDGVVLDVKAGKLKRMTSRAGSHPLPSIPNMKATGEIVALLKEAGQGDLVITVVSGGGSALLCWPTDLSCDQLAMLTKTLMRRGATIQEINTLRKHTSDILGGQLVALSAPADVVGLIFSDVPGDDLSMIASGPTVLDRSTVADAKAVLRQYDLLKACRLPSCQLKETPKDPKAFAHVQNVLVVSNVTALKAMEAEALARGYRPRFLRSKLIGEARVVGKKLAQSVKPGEAFLGAGETTVTITGKGQGGRNQEVAQGALAHVPDDGLVISLASDGIDNTPAAGAIADQLTRQSAARLGLSLERALEENDSFPFFKKIGAQIMTGATGRNVSDLMIALRKK